MNEGISSMIDACLNLAVNICDAMHSSLTETYLYSFEKGLNTTLVLRNSMKINNTPMFRVMVCPSLKPRSSFGVESGA